MFDYIRVQFDSMDSGKEQSDLFKSFMPEEKRLRDTSSITKNTYVLQFMREEIFKEEQLGKSKKKDLTEEEQRKADIVSKV